MKKEKKIDVVFILDKSGSMGGSENLTISSYNEYLEKEKKNEYTTYLTTVFFSDDYTYLYKRENIKEVPKLTKKDYVVGGCTALYDALGSTIHFFEKEQTEKVLFVILTDGYENASVEYQQVQIKNLIQKHKEWEFVYLGANIDSFSEGEAIGLKKRNIANVSITEKCMPVFFESISNLSKKVVCEEKLDNSWKREIDQLTNDID